MSITDKKEEILAKGEAQRGQFDPEPGSAPVRMYQYWVDNSWVHGQSAPTRENFCHYWRIVLIWGPLWWLFLHTLYPVFTSRPAKAAARGLRKIHIPQRIKTFFNENEEKILLGMVYALTAAFCATLLGILIYALIAKTVDTLIILGIIAATAAVVTLLIMTISYFVDRAAAKNRKIEDAAFEAYYKGEGPHPYDRMEEKEPGRLKRFFKAVGEYVSVFFTVLRTKKWKICPFVTVPGVDDGR
jgi:hypothetical protein